MKREVIERLWKQAEEKSELHREKFYIRQEKECRIDFEGEAPVVRFQVFNDLPGVNAGFSTRFGGVSNGELGELNLGFGRGDNPAAVQRNYQIFSKSFGVKTGQLVLSDQVHGTDIACVSKKDTCAGAVDGDDIGSCQVEKKLTAVDGLFTNERGVCLVTAFADCVPLLFYDPVKCCIASSHSGWRGTAAGMGRKTVEEMVGRFGCRRGDILAVVGPSICQSCYEVGEDVIDEMRKNFAEEEIGKIACASGGKQKKYQLDLWAANTLLLQKCGLKPENIHVSGLCTCCNPELFFSHRASGGQRGNLCGFIMLV